MGKASELDDYLDKRTLTSDEIAERHPKVPELRLRADVPAVEIDETTPASSVIAHLRDENVGTVALREPDTSAAVIVISIERYLDLVGKELASDPFNKEVGLNGIAPTEAALAASHVEQVNPSDTWAPDPV